VIRSRIPSIAAMVNKTIDDIEAELNQIGRPLANDAGVSTTSVLENVFLRTIFSGRSSEVLQCCSIV
jgi:hypothetical protein